MEQIVCFIRIQYDDDVPGDVLKLLGEDYLKLMAHLINNIYDPGEWSKNFIDFLQKEAKSYEMK